MYRKIAHRCGTAHLAATLNKVLLEHIRRVLPDLKSKIASQLEQSEKELQAYGGGGGALGDVDEARNQGAQLLALLTRFSGDFASAIEGKLTEQPGAAATKELYGGARINYIFTEIFGKYLKGMSPTDGLSLDDIRTALRNATGPRTALFVPEIAFELLTKRQVRLVLTLLTSPISLPSPVCRSGDASGGARAAVRGRGARGAHAHRGAGAE